MELRFTPVDIAEVFRRLALIDDDVPVDVEPGVPLPPDARTVGGLLAQPAWPEGFSLVVQREPVIEVRVEHPRR